MKASCHCGAVVLEVTVPVDLSAAARCDCSFCRRRGAPALAVPKEAIKILQGADHLTLYQFGTKTARHHFCRTCGIYMFHNQRTDPTKAGVNLGTLEGVNPAEYEPIRWNDGVNHPSDRKAKDAP